MRKDACNVAGEMSFLDPVLVVGQDAGHTRQGRMDRAPVDAWIRATRGMDRSMLERFAEFVRTVDPEAGGDVDRLNALRMTFAVGKDPGAYPLRFEGS